MRIPIHNAEPVRSTCPYCGVGCGVLATHRDDGSVAISGDPEHPANFGRLCSKGSALGETLGLDGRLLYPEVGGRRVSWEQALDTVAARFAEVIEQHGPDSVAFYVSGQLLTEDYYVANKLMKGYLGSANIDTNSRLCMSSTVVGQQRAFGEDLVLGCYEDLELADLIVLVGSNAAWCHPVLFQRISAAKEARPGMRVVVIDPRATATCDIADLHLALRPGTDVALFNGLLRHMADAGLVDYTVEGAEATVDAACQVPSGDLDALAEYCDLPKASLAEFFAAFAVTEKVVTAWSQGVNQSSSGTDKVNAIINCHLASGRIGHPGMGPLSLTGQPNAMGGREVGGMASTLAAHMGFSEAETRRVQRFWQSPTVATRPGLKAVELFRGVAEGRIKALWVIGTNPAFSLPDADMVNAALAACEFLVVSDCERMTDTTRHADVLLPALAWGEKAGMVSNSERRISRQRAFLPPPGEARADWWALSRVACLLGHGEHFDYTNPAEIFREHAALTAFENAGERQLNLGGVIGMEVRDYADWQPLQWPIQSLAEGTARLSPAHTAMLALTPREPAFNCSPRRPLRLNTGRTRDQWHSMTRSARAPRLNQHRPEPWLSTHSQDALKHNLANGELVKVESDWGNATLRLRLDDNQRPGEVFAPMHWSAAHSAGGRVCALVNPVVDRWSGQPESKHTPVSLQRVAVEWEASLLLRGEQSVLADEVAALADYSVLVRGEGYCRYQLAGWQSTQRAELASHYLQRGADCGWLEYSDPAAGVQRYALLIEERLHEVLFVAPTADAAQMPTWIESAMSRGEALSLAERRALLSGVAPGPAAEPGALICACFGVGERSIVSAIAAGCDSLESLGDRLKCGSNCGACRPELRELLAHHNEPVVESPAIGSTLSIKTLC